jgi:hypothetical protein
VASFDVVLKTSGSLHPGGEPTDFVSAHAGLVTCTDDETGAVSRVGRVSALRVHARLAGRAGEPLFDVCDAHSAELHHLHALLYDADGYHFRDAVAARFGAADPDLLVLDYVVLSPEWRGLKLGLLAVRKVVDLLGGGCGLAVSNVAPLRASAHKLLGVPRAWLPEQEGREARREAAVKLRHYFRRMGFRRLGRTPYYALPLNRATPSATDLLSGSPPGV